MEKSFPKLIRACTVPQSLMRLLKGQLNYLNQNGFEVISVSSPGELVEVVQKNEGIAVREVEMSRQISPFKDFVSLVRMIHLFRKESPLIVHSITPKAGLLCMLAAKITDVPFRIHTFTGLIFPYKTGFIQKLLIQMDRVLCWAATHIYPEGEGVKNDLIEYKITNKSLKVIANGNVNGIDTSYFNPKNYTQQQSQALRQQLGIQEKDFVFIFVGRLVGDKGINELIKVFKSLSFGEGFRVRLLLVGIQESELDPLLPETLQEIESNPNIINTGFQEDVRPFFAISDALAFPSYREGFPNVVMQAGAMGLPSIVSDINGCNEIIIEGKNGLIIPSKNSGALQQAMLRLIEDQDLYQQLKSNAREMITSRYEQELVWEALLDEYESLLKEKGMDLGLESEQDLDPEINSG